MKFARLVVVLILTAFALPAAHAAELTTDEKIRYLVQGTDIGMDTDEVFKTVASSLKEALGDQSPEAIKRISDIMRAEFKKVFPDMTSIYVDAYEAIFTADDIDRLYAFYSTPEGAKLLKKSALASQEIERAVLDRTNVYYRNINKTIQSDPALIGLLAKPPKDL